MGLKWGIFYRMRQLFIDTHKVLAETIPAIQKDIEEIKTNHIEHLETDMAEVKTGIRQIIKKLDSRP